VSPAAFLIRRLCGVILVILGITLVTFVTLHLFPADTARLLAGQQNAEGEELEMRERGELATRHRRHKVTLYTIYDTRNQPMVAKVASAGPSRGTPW